MARWYEQRAKSLERLRYASYEEYLASPRWKAIRSRVLNRCRGICEVCARARAWQVHHRSYCVDAMLGRRLDFLVGCCGDCHERAEFAAGRKVPPRMANKRMSQSAYSDGRVLYGLCKKCRGNPTKRGHDLCGKCKRETAAPPVCNGREESEATP